jgi:hypothetical protein
MLRSEASKFPNIILKIIILRSKYFNHDDDPQHPVATLMNENVFKARVAIEFN